VLGAILLVAWSTWTSRAALEKSLRTRFETELLENAEAIAGMAVDSENWGDSERLQVETALSGLDHVAVFSLEDGRLRCVAASDPGWVGRDLWRLAMVLPEGWEGLVADASGEPALSAGGDLLQVATRVTEDRVLYAGLGTDSLRSELRTLTWGLIFRSVLMVLVVGALVLGILWAWVLRPLQRLAVAGEAMAARRSRERIALEGPSEVAKLAAALNALATDAESEREEAESQGQRWRGLFDQIPAVAFVLSDGGRVLEANGRATEVLGSDLDTLCRKNRTDLLVDAETLRLAPGKTAPVRWVESPMVHEGRPATLAVALDMREARAGQMRTTHLARVLDSVDVMVIELSGEGRVEACNAETARLLNRTVEEMRGLPVSELFAGEPPLPAWSEITAAIHRDGAWRDEMTLSGRAGTAREFALRAASLPGPLAGAPGFLVIGRDVTEHRRLRRSLDRAERLEELGSLAAGIIPEFHHQLNGLLTYTEHLRRLSEDNAELAAGLASIDASAHRAQGLIDRLIQFAQDSVLCMASADLNRLVQEIAAGPEIMENPRVSVTIEVDVDMPPVEVDAPMFSEALRAVVLSTIEAMPKGGTVHLTTRGPASTHSDPLTSMTGSHVVIEVRETSRSIDPEVIHRARDPFFTTRGDNGGLGVIRAAGMIQLMGGELTVQGGQSEGTAVTIAFPVEAPALNPQGNLEVVDMDGGGDAPGSAESLVELISREDTDQAIHELISESEDVGGASPQILEQVTTRREKIAEDEQQGSPPDEEEEEEEEDEECEEDEEEDEDDGDSDEDAASHALLVVDDEEVVLELVCDILEDEPFDVITATDGEEALGAIDTDGDRIFLVLIDLVMPGMDGWRLAEAIAEERPGLPIHIASGYEVSEDDVPPWARSAVAGLIHKPFRAGMLRELIDRHLTRIQPRAAG
jgi:PAS domain S-box-containing protein